MIMGLATLISLILTGIGTYMVFLSFLLAILSNHLFDKALDNPRLRKIVRKMDDTAAKLLIIGAPLSFAAYTTLLWLTK